MRSMLIDCDSCTADLSYCGDCVVTFLTIQTRSGADDVLTDAECAAIEVLSSRGLAAPLRQTGT